MKFGDKMEDKKTAVNIGVTLSTQLISASLSMIAIIGALIVFVIDKRETSIAFFICFSLGFLFFLLSIIKGGKGINIVRNQGYDHNWNLSCSKSFFNSQAIFNLLGIIFCLSSFIFTKPAIDEQSIEFKRLNKNIEQLIDSKVNDNSDIDSLKQEIRLLKKRIDDIEKSKKDKDNKTTLPNTAFM